MCILRLCDERARQYLEIIAKKDEQIKSLVQEMKDTLTPDQWRAWLKRMEWEPYEARNVLKGY
jgi:hypothetical protein